MAPKKTPKTTATKKKGKMSLRSVRNGTSLLLRRAPVRNLLKTRLQEYAETPMFADSKHGKTDKVRLPVSSAQVAQQGMENRMIEILRAAVRVSDEHKRTTVLPKDMVIAFKLLGYEVDSVNKVQVQSKKKAKAKA